MKALLNRSLNEKSALDMIYIKADGTVSKRTIIVHQVKQNFIRAFCFKSRQTKTFRIDNILAVAPANYKKGVRNHA
ncbi:MULTISPECIES: WYL domain-containing protein [Bacillus amyloliquefaciens group]|uniref:WYL domain-containing protein n=1 Tax=Bacillus amyloliquefaciens TaxID=1390 RepID=A0AAP7N692_BACAM|nr:MULTISPECIES: hypothetical protein [Bacillus amyloliquefaciens group]AUS15187.1 hypothetical protein C0W57_02865 [Bacillus velezensis]MBW8281760.1 WYL domain-containing protein [Bacillus amyloliquefaciens]MCM3248666.1 WYL domain-containing protein [Bacillus amyloliquefaciens]MCY7426942.1 WYL domain-containing protein [Bacillus amyloliquefaciens]MDH3090973.1 hypothetical protein [Bacillus amyloliquefaciens]